MTFSPGAFPLEVHLLGGDDYFNGRGESGAGLHFLGPIVPTGGDGNESLIRGSSEPDSSTAATATTSSAARRRTTCSTADPATTARRRKRGRQADRRSRGRRLPRQRRQRHDLRARRRGRPHDQRRPWLRHRANRRRSTLRRWRLRSSSARPSRATTTGSPRALADDDAGLDGDAARRQRRIWFGETPAPCGAATTTNTDSISINGSVGTVETLVLDQRGGFFGPGATPESNTPEIEIATNLGDTTDRVIVYGTEARDVMAAGQSGIATTRTATSTSRSRRAPSTSRSICSAATTTSTAGAPAGRVEVPGPGRADRRRGQRDLIRGGDAADNIDGGAGEDLLDARTGTTCSGRGGRRHVGRGGRCRLDQRRPGDDTFNGSDGDDTFFAQDDEADASISGGAGFDTAYVDTGIDPTPITVENVIGDGAPPPPPGDRLHVRLRDEVGDGDARAGRDGDARRRGLRDSLRTVPVACGAATTTNTDTILSTARRARSRRSRSTCRAGPSPPARPPRRGRPRSRSRSSSATRTT